MECIRVRLLLLFFIPLFAWTYPEDLHYNYSDCDDEWGFFGHRRINRMAVFTLPPELIAFFKSHIEFVTEHAVDPDKRRYATRYEAPRHFIDVDVYGEAPFSDLPREWNAALGKINPFLVIDTRGDTFQFGGFQQVQYLDNHVLISGRSVYRMFGIDSIHINKTQYSDFYKKNVEFNFHSMEWPVEIEDFLELFAAYDLRRTPAAVYIENEISPMGILPWHLVKMQRDLTNAFKQRDMQRILRFATDMGHYVGDAHVPLHTTINYNGQLTDQVGIHAFWESRLPELYADSEYDFFVGKAEYIADKQTHYWDIILNSHSLVDSVLLIEADLRRQFPEDQQICYEERNFQTVRTQCMAFAKAYHDRLAGSVEAQMRASVRNIASAWFTAWVDAGQPDLANYFGSDISESVIEESREYQEAYQQGDVKGRPHDN
jgi:hypothetical protein